jgi:hypothetical protein
MTHITIEREKLKLALEALFDAQTDDDSMEKWDRNKEAITAIKQALAVQQEQKPKFPFGRLQSTVTSPGPYKNHYPACANCNHAYATNHADDCGWACDGVNLFSKRNKLPKETT